MLDNNPFRYCGEYYDKETQTIYLRARYYNPAQGRFTQEDPIRDGYNWYSYCGGNPVNFIDPTGYAVASCFGDIPDLLGGGNDVLSYGLCGGGGGSANNGTNYGYASESTISEPLEELLKVPEVSGVSTGALIAAGTTAISDGPLPIGEIIAIGILIVLVTGVMTFPITSMPTAPTISLPETKAKELVGVEVASQITIGVITEEKVAVQERVEEEIQFNYWEASLIKKTVVLGQPLTVDEAALRVSQGGSIMCRNHAAAFHIIFLNQYYNAVGPEIHGDGFPHYHPTRNHTGYSSIHIWYLLP